MAAAIDYSGWSEGKLRGAVKLHGGDPTGMEKDEMEGWLMAKETSPAVPAIPAKPFVVPEQAWPLGCIIAGIAAVIMALAPQLWPLGAGIGLAVLAYGIVRAWRKISPETRDDKVLFAKEIKGETVGLACFILAMVLGIPGIMWAGAFALFYEAWADFYARGKDEEDEEDDEA